MALISTTVCWLGICFLVEVLSGVSALKCYRCNNEQSNYFCMSDLNLIKCGENMDTCQTTVAYSDVSEKLSIIKSCTLNNSCYVQQNATANVPCDKTNSNWICTSCCHSDGCNISGQDFLQVDRISKWMLCSVLLLCN